jgi:hypothetical protein
MWIVGALVEDYHQQRPATVSAGYLVNDDE